MSFHAEAAESGYVPGFEEDVFISYGHFDNDVPSKGWVSHLHEQLEGRLRQLLGTNLRIWRDRRLTGADALEEVLQHKSSRSALFLSVLSPRYVSSASCAKEVSWFLDAARQQRGVRVGNKSRILRVLKTPLQGAAEPVGILEIDTLGFSFCKEEGGDFSELSAEPNLPGYAEFVQQCGKLAAEINRLLRMMRDEKLAVIESKRPRTVLLAETTKELKQAYDSIRSELTERGHRVLPETRLSADCREELEAEMRDLMPACDLSVHLLGRQYGMVPDGEDGRSVARLQYECVRDNKLDKSFQQLVWIPVDLTNLEPKQREFVASVEQQATPGRLEVFKTGLASFKEGLLDILKPAPQPATPSASKGKSIYLICDQRDLTDSQLQEVRGYLHGEGYPTDLPAFEGDPGELRHMEQTNICETDATVIYYGNAKDVWVMLKRKAVLSVLAEASKRGTRAVYLSCPASDVKKGVYLLAGGALPELGGFPPLLVMGDCGPFRSEKLRPLLERLAAEQKC